MCIIKSEKEVKSFVEEIEKEYLYYLYKEFHSIFPKCCHQATGILCGYIQCFNRGYVHKYVSDVPYPHSYISNNEGVIIDFTSFQYYLTSYFNNIMTEELDKDALYDMVKKYQAFPITKYKGIDVGSGFIEESYIEGTFDVKEIQCRYVAIMEEERIVDNYEFNKNDFMMYCSKFGRDIADLYHL
ncbi:hypothetical protein [Lachnoclostridium sp.]|uniref:hypothetical protein n=1 Tax=Lachnoclostridium sp. TaxID=2028282 RepID=UPI0028995366|nr:hypothetical protein [Lachnoclostridium sp.]